MKITFLAFFFCVVQAPALALQFDLTDDRPTELTDAKITGKLQTAPPRRGLIVDLKVYVISTAGTIQTFPVVFLDETAMTNFGTEICKSKNLEYEGLATFAPIDADDIRAVVTDDLKVFDYHQGLGHQNVMILGSVACKMPPESK